ncbi:LPS export ABC transporter permease LptF [Saccharospirillum sp. HFRX-1]|uniref:LPS export ABC transporter permease LptF n=1 Tax=unclassified Saccharospirillum TaxID=2633430 RepID=UPI0037176459
MFTWYLCREILKPFILITAILSALLIAGEMSEILGRVVSGQYSDWAILAIVGYQLPILIPELLPAAFFLAALTSLNRMSEESERIILHAVGQSDSGILKNVLLFTAVPAMIIMLAFTHWLTPLSESSLTRYLIEQQNRPLTDIVTPGEFFTLNQRNATLYAQRSNPSEGTLLSVFIARVDGDRIAVNTAPSARIETQEQRQYLTLFNGVQRVFALTPGDTEKIDYKQFALYIPSVDNNRASASRDASNTLALWRSGSQSSRSDAIERTLLACLIPVLAVWAVALTRVKPRKGKVGAVALGIVLYIVFTFGQQTLQTGVEKGQLPLIASPWWYLIVLALVGLVWVRRRN